MAKKKAEPKFRRLTLALSCGAYANLEAIAKYAHVSKSFVVTALLDEINSPFARMNFVESTVSPKMMRVQLAMMQRAQEILPQAELDALEIRRMNPEQFREFWGRVMEHGEDDTKGDD